MLLSDKINDTERTREVYIGEEKEILAVKALLLVALGKYVQISPMRNVRINKEMLSILDYYSSQKLGVQVYPLKKKIESFHFLYFFFFIFLFYPL